MKKTDHVPRIESRLKVENNPVPDSSESNRQPIIHLEAVTLEQLQSPEGAKEARALFARNMDKLRHTIALHGPLPAGFVPLRRAVVDRSPSSLSPRSKA
jgi:hypothetical protein